MKNNRKFLPHIDMIGYYQFVTFRTKDSVDEFVKKIRKLKIENSKKEYQIDRYVDTSNKGAYLNRKVLKYFKEFLISLDGEYYDLVSFVIMPNHVHMLFKQKVSLSQIMQKIKGVSSIQINKIVNKKGAFWEENYYDKVIRDEKHFEIVYNYIKNNAINLKDFKERFFSVYE